MTRLSLRPLVLYVTPACPVSLEFSGKGAACQTDRDLSALLLQGHPGIVKLHVLRGTAHGQGELAFSHGSDCHAPREEHEEVRGSHGLMSAVR